jgi:hypothetical protein
VAGRSSQDEMVRSTLALLSASGRSDIQARHDGGRAGSLAGEG